MRVGVDAVAWHAWPLKQRPLRGVLGALLFAGTISGVWGWTRSIPLCACAASFLLVGAAPFFAPARYRLTEAGVEVARLGRSRRRAWTEFGKCRSDRDALTLFAASGRGWLPRHETLFLDGNADEVRAYAEEMVGRAPA